MGINKPAPEGKKPIASPAPQRSPRRISKTKDSPPNLVQRQKFKDVMQEIIEDIDEMYADSFRVGDLRKLIAYTPSILLVDPDEITEIIRIIKEAGVNVSEISELFRRAKEEKDTEGNVEAVRLERITRDLQNHNRKNAH